MLWIISGTGTGAGKTAVATALVRALRLRRPAVGWKPIETGAAGPLGPDQQALLAESTFHVKQEFLNCLPLAASPHLAARDAHRALPVELWVDFANELRQSVDVVVELAGGLFTPLTDAILNVDFVSMLRPERHILVVPDRLGALHDAIATTTAAATRAASPHFILLNQVGRGSLSNLGHAPELARFVQAPVGTLAHADIDVRAEALSKMLFDAV